MVTVKYGISKTDFLMVKKFCVAKYQISNETDEFVSSKILELAFECLMKDVNSIEDSQAKLVRESFWNEQYKKRRDKSDYIVFGSIATKKFIYILKAIKTLYPEIITCEDFVKNSFIAFIGSRYVFHLKGGETSE